MPLPDFSFFQPFSHAASESKEAAYGELDDAAIRLQQRHKARETMLHNGTRTSEEIELALDLHEMVGDAVVTPADLGSPFIKPSDTGAPKLDDGVRRSHRDALTTLNELRDTKRVTAEEYRKLEHDIATRHAKLHTRARLLENGADLLPDNFELLWEASEAHSPELHRQGAVRPKIEPAKSTGVNRAATPAASGTQSPAGSGAGAPPSQNTTAGTVTPQPGPTQSTGAGSPASTAAPSSGAPGGGQPRETSPSATTAPGRGGGPAPKPRAGGAKGHPRTPPTPQPSAVAEHLARNKWRYAAGSAAAALGAYGLHRMLQSQTEAELQQLHENAKSARLEENRMQNYNFKAANGFSFAAHEDDPTDVVKHPTSHTLGAVAKGTAAGAAAGSLLGLAAGKKLHTIGALSLLGAGAGGATGYQKLQQRRDAVERAYGKVDPFELDKTAQHAGGERDMAMYKSAYQQGYEFGLLCAATDSHKQASLLDELKNVAGKAKGAVRDAAEGVKARASANGEALVDAAIRHAAARVEGHMVHLDRTMRAFRARATKDMDTYSLMIKDNPVYKHLSDLELSEPIHALHTAVATDEKAGIIRASAELAKKLKQKLPGFKLGGGGATETASGGSTGGENNPVDAVKGKMSRGLIGAGVVGGLGLLGAGGYYLTRPADPPAPPAEKMARIMAALYGRGF